MTEQSIAKPSIYIVLASALMWSGPLKAQSSSRSPTELKSSAVDAKGGRHQISDYGEGRAPWDADMVKFAKPDYPSEYRARHIEGTGLFRITLDVKTGSVTNVTVLKSTGSSGLDASAARAIRQWRWRPQRWKEIDMPVTFTMLPHERYVGSARELLAQGAALNRKGDHEKAIVVLSEAIRQQSTFAEAYVFRGAAYQSKGQPDKALSDFNRAIQLDPKSARAYCDRAGLEGGVLGQPDKALADYNEAIHLAPNFQRAFFNRGAHLGWRHDYERAIADFTRAIELMPNDLSAYAQRAYAYARHGDRARAIADAKVAINLKPDTNVYLWRATDLQLRAKAHRILGQMEPALRDLRDAVSVAPKDPSANGGLAWFLATCPGERFRNGSDAVSIAKKACDLSHRKNSDWIDTLAAAYAELGDFEQAIKCEKQALNDSSLAPKEREEREKRLALFQQRKAFRDEI